jgi:hypothetical protein
MVYHLFVPQVRMLVGSPRDFVARLGCAVNVNSNRGMRHDYCAELLERGRCVHSTFGVVWENRCKANKVVVVLRLLA